MARKSGIINTHLHFCLRKVKQLPLNRPEELLLIEVVILRISCYSVAWPLPGPNPRVEFSPKHLFFLTAIRLRASLVAQTVKNLPAIQESQVWSLGWEDPLEKDMATHPSILVWRGPWAEEPSRLQSMGSQRVGHNWAASTFTFKD